jgi:inhibitor of cysteine peptidase
MNVFTHALLIAACLCLSLTACHNATSPTLPTLTLQKQAHSKSFDLKVGQILELVLGANPSTGFIWEIETIDSASLRQQGDPEFIPHCDDDNMVGCGGTMIFRFQAIFPKDSVLRLIYHRPWEKETPPADVFEVTIFVEA